MAGAGVQWLRDEMELVKDAAQTEAFANAVEDTNGVYVVPAFTYLGAPILESIRKRNGCRVDKRL